MSAEVAMEDGSKSSAVMLGYSSSNHQQASLPHQLKSSPPMGRSAVQATGFGTANHNSTDSASNDGVDSGHEDEQLNDNGGCPASTGGLAIEEAEDESHVPNMAESTYYERSNAQHVRTNEQSADDVEEEDVELPARDDEDDDDDRQQLQHQQQQYSSLMSHESHQSSSIALHHHQQQLLGVCSLPVGDSGNIKSEAASNSSDRDEPAAAGDYYEHSAGGGVASDYSDLLPGNTSRDGLSTVVRTRRRKAGLPEDERVCAVCGDPASGYNFDRLTCESCKAFFRRNALKAREKIKPCSRGGGCDVSGSQRKHCPTCRLEKCVRVGMKKELILPPEKLEQRAKPKKRAKNSDLPSGTPAALSPTASAPSQPKRAARGSSSGSQHHHTQQQQQHQLQYQHHQPAAHHGLNNGQQQQQQQAACVDLDPPSFGSQLHHQQQLHLQQLHRQRCASPPSSSSPTSAADAQQPPELASLWSVATTAGRRWPRDLTPTDQECLASLGEALSRARETLGSAASNSATGGDRKDGVGRLEQAFNQMDACIRRIISVVKLIPIFSDVEKDSQILMLKVNIYGLVILYSSFFNNAESQFGGGGGGGLSLMQELAASVSAIIEMRPDVSDLTPADLEQYRANTDNVYAQLERHSRRDDLVKMLLLALKLFNSDTMPASVRGAIDEAQSVYSQLLKKYLAYKFGVAEAMQMYPRLLMTFIDMRTVENKMTEFTKLLSVESLNPLVREVTQVN